MLSALAPAASLPVRVDAALAPAASLPVRVDAALAPATSLPIIRGDTVPPPMPRLQPLPPSRRPGSGTFFKSPQGVRPPGRGRTSWGEQRAGGRAAGRGGLLSQGRAGPREGTWAGGWSPGPGCPSPGSTWPTQPAAGRPARGPPPLHVIQGAPHCALGPRPVPGTPCLLPKEPTRWGPHWSQGRGPGCAGHLCDPFSAPRGQPVSAAPTDAPCSASGQAQSGEPQSPAWVLKRLDATRACK